MSIDKKPTPFYFPEAREIIVSKTFENYPMSEKYRKLQAKTGLDFSAIIYLLDHLPVFLNGDVHKNIRKKMATVIATSKTQQEEAVRTTVDQLLSRYFHSNCEFDLVADFAKIIWKAISRQIIGETTELQNVVETIPFLFDPTLSIRKRLAINSTLNKNIKKTDEEAMLKIALASVGSRPFVGSIVLSIFDTIEKNLGSPLANYEWAEDYGVSSLTYVDRICMKDQTINSSHVLKNERVRCITQSEQYSADENLAALYGFGRHLCLGRHISQYTYSYLIQEFKRISSVLTPLSLQMEKQSKPFRLPQSAIISIQVTS